MFSFKVEATQEQRSLVLGPQQQNLRPSELAKRRNPSKSDAATREKKLG